MPSLSVISTNAWAVSSACARLSIWQGPAISASGRSLPTRICPMATWRGLVVMSDQPGLVQRGADERREQRVRLERLRLELRMKLHADEPRMVGELDDLGQLAVR